MLTGGTLPLEGACQTPIRDTTSPSLTRVIFRRHVVVAGFHLPLHRGGHPELQTEAVCDTITRFPLRPCKHSTRPPTIAPHAYIPARTGAGRRTTASPSLWRRYHYPPACYCSPSRLYLFARRLCTARIRRRTQRRMARTAFARNSRVWWLPQARNTDSARGSVPVAVGCDDLIHALREIEQSKPGPRSRRAHAA